MNTSVRTSKEASNRKPKKLLFPDRVNLKLDNETIFLTAGGLQSPRSLAEWCEAVRKATTAQVGKVENLLKWPPKDRHVLLGILKHLPQGTQYTFSGDTLSYAHLLNALLPCCPPSSDHQRVEAWLLCVLEIIAALSPIPQPACNVVLNSLHAAGHKGFTLASLLKKVSEIKAAWQNMQQVKPDTGPTVSTAVWGDLPSGVPPEFMMPGNWVQTPEGLARRNNDGPSKFEIPPLLITAMYIDRATGKRSLNIAWKDRGEWNCHIVPRELVAENKTVVSLATYGLSVHSQNAGLVVSYLAEFEQANMNWLKPKNVSSQLGWQGDDGELGFLYGHESMAASPGDSEDAGGSVLFRGADEGDKQLADAYSAAGDLETWKEAILSVSPFYRVMFMVYASLATPLLKILGVQSFGIDLSALTSTGKTTAMEIAASCWGICDRDAENTLIKNFNATSVWRERAKNLNRDLPMMIDDSKTAKSPQNIAEMVYGLTQNGRGRGTIKGLQRNQSSRTIWFTTGEQSITSFTEDGGVRPRVLTIHGTPFEKQSEETAKLIRDLRQTLLKHYGHAGRTFVRYIVANKAQWKTWKLLFRKHLDGYSHRAGGNAFGAIVQSRVLD